MTFHHKFTRLPLGADALPMAHSLVTRSMLFLAWGMVLVGAGVAIFVFMDGYDTEYTELTTSAPSLTNSNSQIGWDDDTMYDVTKFYWNFMAQRPGISMASGAAASASSDITHVMVLIDKSFGVANSGEGGAGGSGGGGGGGGGGPPPSGGGGATVLDEGSKGLKGIYASMAGFVNVTVTRSSAPNITYPIALRCWRMMFVGKLRITEIVGLNNKNLKLTVWHDQFYPYTERLRFQYEYDGFTLVDMGTASFAYDMRSRLCSHAGEWDVFNSTRISTASMPTSRIGVLIALMFEASETAVLTIGTSRNAIFTLVGSSLGVFLAIVGVVPLAIRCFFRRYFREVDDETKLANWGRGSSRQRNGAEHRESISLRSGGGGGGGGDTGNGAMSTTAIISNRGGEES